MTCRALHTSPYLHVGAIILHDCASLSPSSPPVTAAAPAVHATTRAAAATAAVAAVAVTTAAVVPATLQQIGGFIHGNPNRRARGLPAVDDHDHVVGGRWSEEAGDVPGAVQPPWSDTRPLVDLLHSFPGYLTWRSPILEK